VVTWIRHPDLGWRCYVLGRRYHHGMAGLHLIGIGVAGLLRAPHLGLLCAGVGIALVAHDWGDRWFLHDGP